MCEIADVMKRGGGTFVCCTSTAAEFMGASAVDLLSNGKTFSVKRFHIGKARQCFKANPVAPVIKLEEDVPDNFLRKGVAVVFNP